MKPEADGRETERPIAAHSGREPGWDLALVPATAAQDGHVLFSPLWGDMQLVVLKGNPWG